MIVWEDSYKIGHDWMDSEHLIIFSLLNQIDININGDALPQSTFDVVSVLATYIDGHFAREEQLMETSGFPSIAEQKAAHGAFRAELARLRETSASDGMEAASPRIRSFVLDWLLNHILSTDPGYARHIAAKGG